jgi:hypothetical protein
MNHSTTVGLMYIDVILQWHFEHGRWYQLENDPYRPLLLDAYYQIWQPVCYAP